MHLHPENGEIAFSGSCEKSQAATEQALSPPFQESNAQSARTQVSFAAAKSSFCLLELSVTWLHSKANEGCDMSRETILYNGRSLRYSSYKQQDSNQWPVGVFHAQE